MNLLIKVHAMEAELQYLTVKFHAFCDLFEVVNILEGDADQAQILND